MNIVHRLLYKILNQIGTNFLLLFNTKEIYYVLIIIEEKLKRKLI